jgi:trk system potassium uptake protein
MSRQLAIIGLGNFGSQLAVELSRRGAEVLALDERADALDDVRGVVTHAVRLDATDERALADQRLAEMDAVVVSFGANFEAALLTVTLLKQLGVPRVIVRAMTRRHERILRSLGVDEVVLPVSESVRRLASSLMVEGFVDFFPVSAEHTIAEVAAPDSVLGRKVGEIDFVEELGVVLITIRRVEEEKRLFGLGTKTVERILGIVSRSETIERGDTLIVFGPRRSLESLAKR